MQNLPDFDSPFGKAAFIQKLQKIARKTEFMDSEKFSRMCELILCMEYMLITRPLRRLALSMHCHAEKEDARKQMEKRFTKLGPKSFDDLQHDAMENEIRGEHWVNS